jgi:hypothetical protein
MSVRGDRLSAGLLLHVPGKTFRIPDVFGIGPALVQPPEILQKAVRVPPRTTEFTGNRVPFRLQFFPERRVILFDKFPARKGGWGPVGREDECFFARDLRQFISKVEERFVVFC